MHARDRSGVEHRQERDDGWAVLQDKCDALGPRGTIGAIEADLREHVHGEGEDVEPVLLLRPAAHVCRGGEKEEEEEEAEEAEEGEEGKGGMRALDPPTRGAEPHSPHQLFLKLQVTLHHAADLAEDAGASLEDPDCGLQHLERCFVAKLTCTVPPVRKKNRKKTSEKHRQHKS